MRRPLGSSLTRTRPGRTPWRRPRRFQPTTSKTITSRPLANGTARSAQTPRRARRPMPSAPARPPRRRPRSARCHRASLRPGGPRRPEGHRPGSRVGGRPQLATPTGRRHAQTGFDSTARTRTGRRGTPTGCCGSPSCRSCSAPRRCAATWSTPWSSSTATSPAPGAGRTPTRRRCSSASAPAERGGPGRIRPVRASLSHPVDAIGLSLCKATGECDRWTSPAPGRALRGATPPPQGGRLSDARLAERSRGRGPGSLAARQPRRRRGHREPARLGRPRSSPGCA
jgi:hypothetical protein